jgi:hypothetical protein
MANIINIYAENHYAEFSINLDLVTHVSALLNDYAQVSNSTAPSVQVYHVYFGGDKTESSLKIRDDIFPREQFIRQWAGQPLYDSKFLEGCIVLDWEFE